MIILIINKMNLHISITPIINFELVLEWRPSLSVTCAEMTPIDTKVFVKQVAFSMHQKYINKISFHV